LGLARVDAIKDGVKSLYDGRLIADSPRIEETGYRALMRDSGARKRFYGAG
jgi:hypothetical protein